MAAIREEDGSVWFGVRSVKIQGIKRQVLRHRRIGRGKLFLAEEWKKSK
ncbi:hypothetical protein L195_g059177 [Trifolium pratense]|uniref:Uncharacterized protein n=1 Tax=Trifolium pratense TaxID=57577 RepID=A0A2K3JWL8_TRIPR|nr:hypothetical protein L195_g059177 [Trifolium pratense]